MTYYQVTSKIAHHSKSFVCTTKVKEVLKWEVELTAMATAPIILMYRDKITKKKKPNFLPSTYWTAPSTIQPFLATTYDYCRNAQQGLLRNNFVHFRYD